MRWIGSRFTILGIFPLCPDWLTWPNRKNTNQFQIFFSANFWRGGLHPTREEMWKPRSVKRKKKSTFTYQVQRPKITSCFARQSRYTNCPFSPLPLFGSSCIAKLLKVFSASFLKPCESLFSFFSFESKANDDLSLVRVSCGNNNSHLSGWPDNAWLIKDNNQF